MKYGHVPLLFRWQGMGCFKPKPSYIIQKPSQSPYIEKKKKQWHVTIFCHLMAKLQNHCYVTTVQTACFHWHFFVDLYLYINNCSNF